MHRTLQQAAWLAALGLVPALAAGQSPQPGDLAGPKVTSKANAAATALLKRDFTGSVVMPERPPEEIALEALGLDGPGASPADRESLPKAQAVLTKRARILDEFVVGNVPLLTKLGNAAGGNDPLDKLALASQAYSALAPLREGGTLQEQVKRTLTPEAGKRFDATLAAFWQAYTAERVKTPKPDGKLPSKFEVLAGARLESLGREIERSFMRVQTSGELIYRLATEGMRLRDDQSAALRRIAAEFAAAQVKGAEAEVGRSMFMNALSTLDEEQRPTFIRNLRRLGGEPAKEPKAEKAAGQNAKAGKKVESVKKAPATKEPTKKALPATKSEPAQAPGGGPK